MKRPQGTRSSAETSWLSAECALAFRPGYEDLHDACRQTADLPLPGSVGLLLMRRCPCACHASATRGTR
ncbi:hypothetical protein [Streptomyces griseochromogenes]|nr:hypothetical protein [Streptomyces griseochromogenes]ANP56226.1 hypothetical protein AVL59_01225 [Streptomyces griseochromogenes]